MDGTGIRYHNYSAVGTYTVFPAQYKQRLFPSGAFGRIEKDEVETTGTLGLMCREQGLRITNDLARMTLPSERNVDYGKIAHSMTSTQIKKDLLFDEVCYTALVQDLSLDLHDVIFKSEKKLELKKFFLPPGVFDGLINVMVQQFTKNPIRVHLCDKNARKALVTQIVTKMVSSVTERDPRSFAAVCEILPCIKLELPKANLSGSFADLQKHDVVAYKLYLQGYHKFCNHHWRPVDIRSVTNEGFKGANSGVLLWGEQGCGKSQILSYLTAWAHESNWCSVAITDHEAFVNKQYDIFRCKNGLYMQKELAKRLCQDFLTSNEQLLRDTPVDMAIYGSYDLTGIRDDEPEPCPRVWDEARKTWSDAWKEFLFEHEINFYKNKYDRMNYRLSDKLRDPKTLYEIAEAGVKDAEVATNAFGELLNQCYHTDRFKTMMCVDGVNVFMQPSQYPSFRYANQRKLNSFIPPYHLALVRLIQ